MTRARTTVQSAFVDLCACCELVFTGFPVHDTAVNKCGSLFYRHFRENSLKRRNCSTGKVSQPWHAAMASKHDT